VHVTSSTVPPVSGTQVGAPPAASRPAVAVEATSGETRDEKKGHVITSPFVGTFYRSPSPDQPSFVEVGGAVKKGQVLCIIEAMKLMNEIEAEVSGKVSEVLAQNGQPVEFGQPLIKVDDENKIVPEASSAGLEQEAIPGDPSTIPLDQ
jgi:acetyl-CoA carboxylase biotin carboxyl carrier protein